MVQWHRPYFRVRYDDFDSEELAGWELAKHLCFSTEDFLDPRRWYYDFSVIHPADIPGWRAALKSFCKGFGWLLPSRWLENRARDGHATGSAAPASGAGAPRISWASGRAAYREAELDALRAVHIGFLEQTRCPRTIDKYRNPGLKMIWWIACHGLMLTPTPGEVALYFAKGAAERGNTGAVQTAAEAWTYILEFNGLDAKPFQTDHVRAALEAQKRINKRPTRKSAGVTVEMVEAVIRVYCFVRISRTADGQWELAIGTAIAVGFKLLLRYDDLRRCRWDEGYCEVFPTHVRFFLDGRKNDQYRGSFVDIARPEDPREKGVYHVVARARSVFRTGFVLPKIDGKGRVSQFESMSHKKFVLHLRAALVHIGVPAEEARKYSAQGLRGGGATAAVLGGLSSEDIAHLAGVRDLNWLAYYNRNHLSTRLRASRALGL